MSEIRFVNELGDALEAAAAEHIRASGQPGGRRRPRWLRSRAGRQQRSDWAGRRIRVGGFAVPPLAALVVVATAAAATTAAVTLSATTLFQSNPEAQAMAQMAGDGNNADQTVLSSTVSQVASVSIPDYGQVEVWSALSKPGGLCVAMKLPDGDWGGLHQSVDAQGDWDGGAGWVGGPVPGCFKTQQQQILEQTPLKPGQQPSPTTGQEQYPAPLEEWDNEFKNSDGQQYTIYTGYVEVQGTATTVRDPDTGATTQVLPGGYYALLERTPGNCEGCDAGDLQVLNAAGQQLKPDYTWGEMLPGYSPGPSQS